MPELPEVETVKRGLGPLILNKKIVQVRVAEPKCFLGEKTEVEGAKVVGLRRRGKALLIDLDNGRTVMVHLRMTGQLIWRKGDLLDGRVSPEIDRVGTEVLRAEQFAAGHPSKNFTAALPNKQTRVTLVFGDGAVFFNDQRKFGFMKVLPTAAEVWVYESAANRGGGAGEVHCGAGEGAVGDDGGGTFRGVSAARAGAD